MLALALAPAVATSTDAAMIVTVSCSVQTCLPQRGCSNANSFAGAALALLPCLLCCVRRKALLMVSKFSVWKILTVSREYRKSVGLMAPTVSFEYTRRYLCNPAFLFNSRILQSHGYPPVCRGRGSPRAERPAPTFGVKWLKKAAHRSSYKQFIGHIKLEVIDAWNLTHLRKQAYGSYRSTTRGVESGRMVAIAPAKGARAPEKGSFPLDHGGECKPHMKVRKYVSKNIVDRRPA